MIRCFTFTFDSSDPNLGNGSECTGRASIGGSQVLVDHIELHRHSVSISAPDGAADALVNTLLSYSFSADSEAVLTGNALELMSFRAGSYYVNAWDMRGRRAFLFFQSDHEPTPVLRSLQGSHEVWRGSADVAGDRRVRFSAASFDDNNVILVATINSEQRLLDVAGDEQTYPNATLLEFDTEGRVINATSP